MLNPCTPLPLLSPTSQLCLWHHEGREHNCQRRRGRWLMHMHPTCAPPLPAASAALLSALHMMLRENRRQQLRWRWRQLQIEYELLRLELAEQHLCAEGCLERRSQSGGIYASSPEHGPARDPDLAPGRVRARSRSEQLCLEARPTARPRRASSSGRSCGSAHTG